MTATATPLGDGSYRVVATVAGIDSFSYLTVTQSGLADLESGSGCQLQGQLGALCLFAGSPPTRTLEFVATPRAGQPASMTFVVDSLFGGDPDTSNNRYTLNLPAITPPRAPTSGPS